ncbi:MAG: DUF3810 domain-containing protein [Bacillota bacterium]
MSAKPARKAKKTKKALRFRDFLFCLALVGLGIALPRLAALSPETVESLFSNGLYPAVSSALGTVTGLLPFSLAEILLVGGALVLLLLVLQKLWQLLKKRLSFQKLLCFLVALLIVFGVLLNAFYFEWGFNYARPKLAQLMNLTIKERSAEELNELCESLRAKAILLRGQVSEDKDGVFTLEGGYLEEFKKIPAAYVKLGSTNPLFARGVPVAKGVFFSESLSKAGISGIYIPFTAEANVNVDQPPLLVLSSAAHESAHFCGIAREDEANFVAYLACSASSDPSVAYSGTMLALINCSNALCDADPGLYGALRERYSDAMERDLADYRAYWDAFEGPVKETMNKVNDNYLKYNLQESGVKSYGEMVDLMLAYYFG